MPKAPPLSFEERLPRSNIVSGTKSVSVVNTASIADDDSLLDGFSLIVPVHDSNDHLQLNIVDLKENTH